MLGWRYSYVATSNDPTLVATLKIRTSLLDSNIDVGSEMVSSYDSRLDTGTEKVRS